MNLKLIGPVMPAAWLPSHAYTLGQNILDSNGNIQLVTTAGTSAVSAPVWNALTAGSTPDTSPLVWQNMGPQGTGEPLNVEDTKAQLRYGLDDQDNYIAGLIVAARNVAEFWNGRKMVLSQWVLALDSWPGCANWTPGSMPDPYWGNWPSDAYRLLASQPWGLNAIKLLAPLVSVQSVTFKDSTGTVNTLVENTDFISDTFKEPGLIAPMPNGQWPLVSLWPSSAIQIKFTCGMVPNAAAYTAANPSLPCPPQVPNNILQGMLLIVSTWFVNRVDTDQIRFVAEPPFGANALFTANRLWK